jgi:hypothetical protein
MPGWGQSAGRPVFAGKTLAQFTYRWNIVDGGNPVAGAPHVAPGLGFVRQGLELALADPCTSSSR